jgi:hypothetical protein
MASDSVAIRTWIGNVIHRARFILMTYEEQERMISYFVGHWDDGALRTVHVHFGECNEWAEQFFLQVLLQVF